MDTLEILITLFISLLMLQTGMSCDIVEVKKGFNPNTAKAILGLGLINFLVIPVITFATLLPFTGYSPIGLAIITLAILPCAPIVPSLATSLGDTMEWSASIFVLFSVVSLFMVTLLSFLVPAQGLGHEQVYLGLSRYLLVIYFPLFAGMGLRKARPTICLAWFHKSKAIIGIGLLAVTLFYIGCNIKLITSLPLSELISMVIFSAICLAVGLFTPIKVGGQPFTLMLSTTFRNITLALPFSILVLDDERVTVHVIALGVLGAIMAILGIGLLIFWRRLTITE